LVKYVSVMINKIILFFSIIFLSIYANANVIKKEYYATHTCAKRSFAIMLTGTDKLSCGLIGGQQEFIFE